MQHAHAGNEDARWIDDDTRCDDTMHSEMEYFVASKMHVCIVNF